jgi:hypothetical protein
MAQLDRWIDEIDAVRSSIVEIAAMPEISQDFME